MAILKVDKITFNGKSKFEIQWYPHNCITSKTFWIILSLLRLIQVTFQNYEFNF
jgi:hypothetical protein